MPRQVDKMKSAGTIAKQEDLRSRSNGREKLSSVPTVSHSDGFWPESTPEEQGIDTAKLLEMLTYYQNKHTRKPSVVIDSITIIRNGFLVADLYLNPLFPKDTKHVIHSCTKSIMSILIGIAIEQGYIEHVRVPVLNFLGNKLSGSYDKRLEALTIEDLLTMQTGLRSEDSYLYQWRGLFAMQATDDWVRHALTLPMDVDPGTRFDYSNISSFLLSAVLMASTGIDTLTFAKTHLFTPLGIEDVRWETSPLGIHIGWARMWLKPHDMAKIGMLYLQQGQWEGKQIISSDWVATSTRAHSYPERYRHFRKEGGRVDYLASVLLWLFTNLARPFAEGYGYQWWLDKNGMYAAIGVGGQYIMVVPDKALVVVFTSKLRGPDSFVPSRLLKKFIVPAVLSEVPLPPNEEAYTKLMAYATPPEIVRERQPVASLPSVATAISGAIYKLEPNQWRHTELSLTFAQDAPTASFAYRSDDKGEVRYEVGLDNVFRLTDSRADQYAAKGSWTTPTTFVIDYEQVGYSNTGQWRLSFAEDGVEVTEVGVTGEQQYRGKLVQTP